MTENKHEPTPSANRERPAEPAEKKAYVAPRIIAHDALEVITGACTQPGFGKEPGACTFGTS